jgi:hypothetical protein
VAVVTARTANQHCKTRVNTLVFCSSTSTPSPNAGRGRPSSAVMSATPEKTRSQTNVYENRSRLC